MTMVHPTKISFCELVQFDMTLDLSSDCGVRIAATTEQFQNNNAPDSEILEAFDKQCECLRRHIQQYKDRKDRKENWAG